MKTFLMLSCSALLFFAAADDCLARTRSKRGDYFLRPQVGFWFGPATPVYETWGLLDPYLGAGAFFRYNLPYEYLKVGFDVSYQQHGSKGVNELKMIPYYGTFLYRLPLSFPLMFQLKAGAGACHLEVKPDNISQNDPLFVFGGEMSFPAGRTVIIGLSIDYLLVYDKYMEGATQNGHMVNAGITCT